MTEVRIDIDKKGRRSGVYFFGLRTFFLVLIIFVFLLEK